MSRLNTVSIPSSVFKTRLRMLAVSCLAILSFLTLGSCGGTSCFIAVWNFPGPISTGNGACSFNAAKGNVAVRLTSAASFTAAPMTPNLRHIFISLEGIEAHQDAAAGENSPGWEEMAPNLMKEPVQVDLMAQPAQSCASSPISRALVIAGAYKQLRLRLVPSRPSADALVPKENACGGIGFHCVVTANNTLRALTLAPAESEIRVAPARIAGGFFHVLPDTDTDLVIEFNPVSSFAVPAGNAVQLAPVFTADFIPSCNSAEQSTAP